MSERASAMMSASGSAAQSSESDGLAALLTPFRQAQTLLGQVTDVARSLADDTLFEEVFAGLSSLPSAANFNPLQSAQSLPVDIAPVQAAVEQAAQIPRQFIDALQQKARHGSSATHVHARQRQATGPQLQAKSPSPKKGSPLVTLTQGLGELQQHANDLLTAGGKSIAAQGQVLQNTLKSTVQATRGSWAALETIADLVDGFASEPATPQKSGAGKSSPMATSPQGVTSSARGGAGEQAAVSTAKTERNHGQQGEQEITGLLMLQGLVDAALGGLSVGRQHAPSAAGTHGRSDRNAQGVSPSSEAAPSSRGSSMLSPQLSSRPGSATIASTSTSGNTSNERTVSDRAASDRSEPPKSGVINDDELAERLNRALIEQAWRGGVDLT